MIVLIQEHLTKLGLANPDGILKHRPEYGRKLAGRTADDSKDLRGRSLLLQRLPQLAEQAGILDGDDGLRGEIRNQGDLLVGERPHLLAVDGNRADELVVLEHWYVDRRASAS